MTDLNTHITDILTAHAGTTYHADCPPSLVTRLALRVRELTAAVQAHHDRHYFPVDYCAARPTNAPHDRDLYEAAGVLWMRPEPWDANPAYYRLTAMRAHWARKQVDALTVDETAHLLASPANAARLAEALDQVRVDNVPEQMA